MSQFLNEPDNAFQLLQKRYQECVQSHQRLGAEMAELEDLLFDEAGVEGDELAECVRALIAERDEYRWIYEGLCK